MCSLAVSPLCLTTIEQRWLRGPSLWSGSSCLVTVLEMGPLARALTSDFPGLDQRLLAEFPCLHQYAEALRRGAFIAEVLGWIARGLQRLPGRTLTVHGRLSQVRIVIPAQDRQVASHALEQATIMLFGLCAEAHAASAWPVRPARSEDALHFVHAHAGEHGQHEQQRLVAAAQ
jgi:hypothetical protein